MDNKKQHFVQGSELLSEEIAVDGKGVSEHFLKARL